VEPTPERIRLVRVVEGLAGGEHVPGLEHLRGAPTFAGDPRLMAIAELAELAGVGADALDAVTHEQGQRIDRMLEDAMSR